MRSNGYLTLPLIVAATVLTACNGSSSDDGDSTGNIGDNGSGESGSVDLTAEERVLGAAGAMAGQFMSVSQSATEQAGGTLSDSRQARAAGIARNNDISLQCDGAVDASANTGFEANEGSVYTVSELAWKSQFSNAAAFPEASATDSDYQGRFNCVQNDMNDNPVAETLGAFDITQRESIDGNDEKRLVHAVSGGLGSTSLDFDQQPDTTTPLTIKSDAGGFSIDILLRYDMQLCKGCVAGSLNDWNGDPKLDVTSVAFLEMSMSTNGSDMQVTAGERDTPFVFQSEAVSSGARVTADGRLQYSGSGGCRYDVTLDSNSDFLYFDDVSDEAGPTGGTTRVTDNDTGQTYEVDYNSGSARVYLNGTDVTPANTSNIDACGFQDVDGPGTGSDIDAGSDLSGTWEPEFCEQLSANESVNAQYTFTDSSVTATLIFYSDDSCSQVDDVQNATWSYTLGDAVAQTDGLGDAVEIDMISSQAPATDKYDIVRVVGDRLYLGEPDPSTGALEAQFRPDDLDVFDTFSRSQ